jgi:hypothetical protein
VWWCVPVLPVFPKQRKENFKFKANMGDIVKPCLKKKEKKRSQVLVAHTCNPG